MPPAIPPAIAPIFDFRDVVEEFESIPGVDVELFVEEIDDELLEDTDETVVVVLITAAKLALSKVGYRLDVL